MAKPSWITLNRSSGTGNDTITATASEFTGRVSRSGSIIINTAGTSGEVDTATLSISQTAKGLYWNLEKDSITDVTALGSQVLLVISTNSKSFTISPSKGGVTRIEYITTEGSETGEITPSGGIYTIPNDPGSTSQYRLLVTIDNIPENQSLQELSWNVVVADATTTSSKLTVEITQEAGQYSYSAITINSLTANDVPASGGSVTSGTVTYTQTYGWNNATSGVGTITSGATVTWSGGATNIPSLGTTIKSRTDTSKDLTVNISLNGKTASQSISIYQAANVITSYSEIQPLEARYPSIYAAGGTETPIIRYEQTRTYTSGSTDKINSGATITYQRAQITNTNILDIMFMNRSNSVAKYAPASSSSASQIGLERIAQGDEIDAPTDGGYLLKVSNLGGNGTDYTGGFRQNITGLAENDYICTVQLKEPTGYRIQYASNPVGTGGETLTLVPEATTGDWRVASFRANYGTGTVSDTFFFYWIGPQGTENNPIEFLIASCFSVRITNVTATSPTINLQTGAITLPSLGTTVQTARANQDGAVAATISLNGKSVIVAVAPEQLENKVEDSSYTDWIITLSASSSTIPATGGSATITSSASRSRTDTYSSGYTKIIRESGTPVLSISETGFSLSGNKVTATPFTGVDRTCTVTATQGTITKQITITQTGTHQYFTVKSGSTYQDFKLSDGSYYAVKES